MDAILNLIKGYGLEDPVLSDETGAFTNSVIAGLFAQLTSMGDASLVKALKVGADIEILDIAYLEDVFDEAVQANIKKVYTNLKKASEALLKSFSFNLKRQGVIYSQN